MNTYGPQIVAAVGKRVGIFRHMLFSAGYVVKTLKINKKKIQNTYFWLFNPAIWYQFWRNCHVSAGWEWRKTRF
jgi:hypothetical protein